MRGHLRVLRMLYSGVRQHPLAKDLVYRHEIRWKLKLPACT
jgi:hypothetical protein